MTLLSAPQLEFMQGVLGLTGSARLPAAGDGAGLPPSAGDAGGPLPPSGDAQPAHVPAAALPPAAQAADEAKRLKELEATSPKAAAQARALLDQFARAAAGKDEAAKAEALEARQLLDEALASPALAGGKDSRLGDDDRSALVAAFGKDAQLASSAVMQAATAEHPETIARHVGPVCDLAKGGFADASGHQKLDPDQSRAYGARLLDMGGYVGGGWLDELPDYVKSGRQFEPDPLGEEGHRDSWEGLARARATAVAKGMVGADGKVNPDGAHQQMLDLMMNRGVLENGTPELARQTVDTMALLKSPDRGAKALAALNGATTARQDPAAAGLVRDTMGLPPGAQVKDGDLRAAVLAAMCQPVSQGPVGSCFTTGPLRRQREADPLKSMDGLLQVATTGQLKLARGDAVPAVTRLPPGDNALQRSYEYTVATAAALDPGSQENSARRDGLNGGADGFHALYGAKDWPAAKLKLRLALLKAFRLAYDPVVQTAPAADGSSSQGRYVLTQVPGDKEITTRAEFVRALGEVALQVIQPGQDEALRAKVLALVSTDAFIDGFCPRNQPPVNGQPAPYLPWELGSGGYTAQVTAVLTGQDKAPQALVGQAAAGEARGKRTGQVLAGVLEGTRGNAAGMVGVDTEGIHSFNLLPNDPSLFALKGRDAAATAANVQKNLVAPGHALSRTALAPEQAVRLFDAELDRRIADEKDEDAKALLQEGKQKSRPTGAVTPAQLDHAIAAATAAAERHTADGQLAQWQDGETKAGRAPDAQARQKKLEELRQQLSAAAESARSAALASAVVPAKLQFVIADTNWGDAQNHTYFVIAPDPATGEPRLWSKSVPKPGTLEAMGDEWVNAAWDVTS